MSAIYRIKIQSLSLESNKTIVQIEATQDKSQKLPISKTFYFAILGDLYFYSKYGKFGFG